VNAVKLAIRAEQSDAKLQLMSSLRRGIPVFFGSIILSCVLMACTNVRGGAVNVAQGDAGNDVVSAHDGRTDTAVSQDLLPMPFRDVPDRPDWQGVDAGYNDATISADVTLPKDDVLDDVESCRESRQSVDGGFPCQCVGTDDAGVGLCVLPSACRVNQCPGGFGYCAGSPELGALFPTACASRAVCRELASRYDRNPTASPFVCVYGDGTIVRTGLIPVAQCPPGSEGLICGRGCSPCRMGSEECWGASERFPVGFCHVATQICSDSIPCPPIYSCLRPRNLNVTGLPATGVCELTQRCRQAAQLIPERFRCQE
jgi:hypothetical protein